MTALPAPLRRLPFVLLAVLLIAPPNVAQAATATDNFVRADARADAGLLDLFAYGTGTSQTISAQPDFAAGTHVGTSDALVPGSLTLERLVTTDPDLGLAAWWDNNWVTRQCFEIDHSSAGAVDLFNYPVRVMPTMAPLTGLRAVASDDTTVLPHWVNGSDVWVRVDAIPAGGTTHLCLYGNNPTAPEQSNLATAVTSALQPAYVTVNERATGRSVTVVSYIDGNVVSTGTQTVYGLDAGQSFTFTSGITSSTTVSALGPISSRVLGQAADTLVPLSWAGTEFVFPTTRGTQRFSVHAPTADANVTLYRGSLATTVSISVPAGTTQSVNADGGSRAVVVTSDQPVLVSHAAGNRDAFAGYPATTADLFGVPSTRHYVSTNTNGTGVSVFRSNGTNPGYTVNQFQMRIVSPNGATYGNGPAARITGTAPIGTIQQADGNGSESTTFLPLSELSDRYYLPVSATYAAFACPTPGTVIDIVPPVGAPSSVNCTGAGLPYPGKARVGATPAGARFQSQGGEPFYVYYQDSATVDETNLTGPPTSGLTWPEPSGFNPRAVSGIYRPAGQWTSAVINTGTSGVYGLFDWTASTPAGTAVRFQVASAPGAGGPFTFVGPDGTGATYYTHPGPGSDIMAYLHDGLQYAQIQAELSTTDPLATPRVNDITIEADLPELTSPIGGAGTIAVQSTPAGFHHLVRVQGSAGSYGPSSAHLAHVADSNLANIAAADFRIDAYAGPQVEYAAGSVITPTGPDQPFSPPGVYSITLSEATVAPAQSTVLEVRWRVDVAGSGSTFVDRHLEVTINS